MITTVNREELTEDLKGSDLLVDGKRLGTINNDGLTIQVVRAMNAMDVILLDELELEEILGVVKSYTQKPLSHR
ncbi:MAG: hypothetical protein HY507_01140 [Candidatus Zambryskibacteria bacterium]|nr:hypothetical protein [Candidatus Zambryskibacteria bacterium]